MRGTKRRNGFKPHVLEEEKGTTMDPTFVRGTVLPTIALVVGLVTLSITVTLSSYYQHFHWLFVSHMGAIKPAYYFYVMGCTFTGGLLVPSAAIFYLHNNNQILKSTSDYHARALLCPLNKASFATASIGAVGFALQSIFPMVNETTVIHGVFASNFFFVIVLHAIITSYLYYGLHLHCQHTKSCICNENSQFWVRWKVIFAILISIFTLLTVFFLAMALIMDSSVVDVLYQTAHPTSLVVAGAICEYILIVLAILYFCSYLHDLRSVVVSITPYINETKK